MMTSEIDSQSTAKVDGFRHLAAATAQSVRFDEFEHSRPVQASHQA